VSWFRSLCVAIVAAGVVGRSDAHEVPAPGTEATSPYRPYETLIGAWDVGQAGRPAQLVLRFGWGPAHSTITYAAAELTPNGERPHFDGVLMWNGATHALDTLVMLDLSPGASIQEQGAFALQPDGSFVRDITATY